MRDAIDLYRYHRRLGFGRWRALCRTAWCWL